MYLFKYINCIKIWSVLFVIVFVSCDNNFGSLNTNEKIKRSFGENSNYNIEIIDTTYAVKLQKEYSDKLKKYKDKNEFSFYTADKIDRFEYGKKSDVINVFRTKEVFRRKVQIRRMESELGERDITVPSIMKKLYEDQEGAKTYLPADEMSFLNKNGEVIIEDTLFTVSADNIKKTSLSTGETTELSITPKYMDPPCSTCSGNGGSTQDEKDEIIKYFSITDVNGELWQVQLKYGNESYTDGLGIRRSATWTKYKFRQSTSESYDSPPSGASELFPNSHVKAEMKIHANIKIYDVSCPEYYRGSTANFIAQRIKGRCPNTGVVSWHTAVLKGYHDLDNKYVE